MTIEPECYRQKVTSCYAFIIYIAAKDINGYFTGGVIKQMSLNSNLKITTHVIHMCKRLDKNTEYTFMDKPRLVPTEISLEGVHL